MLECLYLCYLSNAGCCSLSCILRNHVISYFQLLPFIIFRPDAVCKYHLTSLWEERLVLASTTLTKAALLKANPGPSFLFPTGCDSLLSLGNVFPPLPTWKQPLWSDLLHSFYSLSEYKSVFPLYLCLSTFPVLRSSSMHVVLQSASFQVISSTVAVFVSFLVIKMNWVYAVYPVHVSPQSVIVYNFTKQSFLLFRNTQIML